MEIGGAEFVMGVSKDTNAPDDFTMALKLVVYGMDSMETAQTVFEKLSQTLLSMDSQLELSEIKGDQTHIN